MENVVLEVMRMLDRADAIGRQLDHVRIELETLIQRTVALARELPDGF